MTPQPIKRVLCHGKPHPQHGVILQKPRRKLRILKEC